MAIRLALYGRHATGIDKSIADYAEYIRGCIHSSPTSVVPLNSTFVELEFVHGKLGRSTQYVVKRSWHDTGSKVREHLDITEDGTSTPLNSEASQGFLNELIPIGISELFFFDGEKIAELADDDSGRALGEAIHRLLGLDLVERLRVDLRTYMLRQEKKNASELTAAKIESLQREFEGVKDDIRLRKASLLEAEASRDSLVAERDRRELQLTERSGVWGASRIVQRERLDGLTAELKRNERELRDEIGGSYPLWLVIEELSTALNEVKESLSLLTNAEANSRLNDFASRLRPLLNQKGKAALDKTLCESTCPTTDSQPIIEMSQLTWSRMLQTVQQELPKSRVRTQRIAEHLYILIDELDTATLRFHQAPDEEALTSQVNELAELNEKIGESNAEIRVLQRELHTLYSHSLRTARALRNKHLEMSEQQDWERPLVYAANTRQLLKDFQTENSERKATQLESEFVGGFKRLAHKDDLIVSARIDPRNFTVTMLDAAGEEIHKARLSAGEKQIYAIAMLEALARTSGRRLPIVIDTPLGRLDSFHRENLVAEYFPRASHQVVLLSTDTEVGEAFYRKLAPHLSHDYEIQFDERQKATKLRNGYFYPRFDRKAS